MYIKKRPLAAIADTDVIRFDLRDFPKGVRTVRVAQETTVAPGTSLDLAATWETAEGDESIAIAGGDATFAQITATGSEVIDLEVYGEYLIFTATVVGAAGTHRLTVLG